MSQELLEALRKNPKTKVKDLPGAREWAKSFFGEQFNLDDNESFAKQAILGIQESDSLFFEVTNWDPYEEDYDDGPGDGIYDCWHTDERSSTGQYSGTVIQPHPKVTDALSAALVCASERRASKALSVVHLDWVPPQSAEERDERNSSKIVELWEGLSKKASSELLASLAHGDLP